VPELPVSITSPGTGSEPPVPVTVQAPSAIATRAPKRSTIPAHERVSAESSGLRITDSPSASSAKVSARMVCDFEPGISIPPPMDEGSTMNFMGALQDDCNRPRRARRTAVCVPEYARCVYIAERVKALVYFVNTKKSHV
jgi:hypothetical protein